MGENETTGGWLQAISNVIELKPDKKYMFVFKGDNFTFQRLHEMFDAMQRAGIQGMAMALNDGEDVQVIEMPEQETDHDH